MKITPNLALGAFPNLPIPQAMALAQDLAEQGRVCLDHVQLCPQNPGHLDVDTVRALAQAHPNTQFRLHANARVTGWSARADLSYMPSAPAYFAELAAVSRALRAPGYTAHAGLRAAATLKDVFYRTEFLQDLFGCRVGIEGLYPRNPQLASCVEDEPYLLATWEEYAQLLESGVSYALDLSHLQIVAAKSGRWETTLVKDLLSSSACLEVHISSNDGMTDAHHTVRGDETWLDWLGGMHPDAVLFTEENQRRPLL